MGTRSLLDETSWRNSENFHEHQHLLGLILSRKDRVPQEKLAENASKRPNINGTRILNSHDNFWSSIVSALNICVYLFALEATRAGINNFNSCFVLLLQQNVLGFEVAVNYFVFFEETESLKDLNCDSSNKIKIQSAELVEFQELVQVYVQKLEN